MSPRSKPNPKSKSKPEPPVSDITPEQSSVIETPKFENNTTYYFVYDNRQEGPLYYGDENLLRRNGVRRWVTSPEQASVYTSLDDALEVRESLRPISVWLEVREMMCFLSNDKKQARLVHVSSYK